VSRDRLRLQRRSHSCGASSWLTLLRAELPDAGLLRQGGVSSSGGGGGGWRAAHLTRSGGCRNRGESGTRTTKRRD
jgi:hypothetical protein